jgi:hypothetical protein
MTATQRAINEYNKGNLMMGESGANTLISFSSDVFEESTSPSDSLK